MKITDPDIRAIQEFAIRKNCSYKKAHEIMKKAHYNPLKATKLLVREKEIEKLFRENERVRLLVEVTECDGKTARIALQETKSDTYTAYKLILKNEKEK